jgi:aspartyl-tRNA(Asn)/glutamyl-tRNA(Gln) amidotransferase subunit C
MGITAADVQHVARLARLTLSEDEVARMAEQLSTVLGHVQQLSELDLHDVEPTAHALDVVNAVRADAARTPWPRDVALAGAPTVQDGLFRVPPGT